MTSNMNFLEADW